MARRTQEPEVTMPAEDRERVEKVVALAFGGLHNVDRLRFYGFYATCGTHGGELATWDGNRLTALVVAGHDQGVRVSVSARGMRLEVMLHPRRCRAGRIAHRHPTLEDAIARYGERDVWTPPADEAAPESGAA